jgi:hypothetical protein
MSREADGSSRSCPSSAQHTSAYVSIRQHTSAYVSRGVKTCDRSYSSSSSAPHTYLCVCVCTYIFLYITLYVYVYVYTPLLALLRLRSPHVFVYPVLSKVFSVYDHRATWPAGTQFTCFTGTKVQILTQKALQVSVEQGLLSL